MESSKHYKDTLTLDFDAYKHEYTIPEWDDAHVDGVTGTLSVAINKPAIIYWAVGRALDTIRDVLVPGKSLDELEIEKLLDTAKWAHKHSATDAATIGNYVHKWISDYITGKKPKLPENPIMKKSIKAFLQFVKENDVRFTDSEQKVLSRKYKYAGTFDFICEIDGKRYVGDIKTSSAIYPEVWLQTGAYDLAYTEEHGGRFDGHIIVNCTKTGKLNVGYSENTKVNQQTFLAALKLVRGLREVRGETLL